MDGILQEVKDSGIRGVPQDLEEKEKEAMAAMERKVRRARDPKCIIIAPKMRETHFLCHLLFGFDKCINNLRLNVGTFVDIKTVLEKSAEIEMFLKRVEEFIAALGGQRYYAMGMQDGPEQKAILVQQRNTYAFVPKTQEAARLAELLKSLDSAMLDYKTKVTLNESMGQMLGKIIQEMKNIISAMLSLTAGLSKLTRTRIKPPRGISAYLDAGHNEGGGNGKNGNNKVEEVPA